MRLENLVGLLAFLSSLSASANILNNPDLIPDKTGLPADWSYNREKSSRHLVMTTENGVRHVAFNPGKGECQLWQTDIHLVPGAKYRLGAWVRTSKLRAAQKGVVLTNWSWITADGPEVPADTGGKWVWIEKTFPAPKSKFEAYSCGAYTVNHESGDFAVRGLTLEAVDDAGRNGAEPAPRFGGYRRITPVDPLLEQIPPGDSFFTYAVIMQEDGLVCNVWLQLNGAAEKYLGEFPVRNDRVRVPLKGMPAARRGCIRAEIKQQGKILAASRHAIAVLPELPRKSKTARRMNNLVERLLTEPAKDGEFSVVVEKDGWIWVDVDRFSAETKVYLDGANAPVAFFREGERLETMRWVERGLHRLRLEGTVGGALTVNAVPTLYCYALPSTYPAGNRSIPYRGEFLRTRLYPSFNTFGYGFNTGITATEWADFHARGKVHLDQEIYWQPRHQGYTNQYESTDSLVERLGRHLARKSFTYDEIFIASLKPKWNYADAMRRLQNVANPPYTWSSGFHFQYTALDAEYYSACLNAGHGKGRFMFEIYPDFETVDPVRAEEYLREILDETRIRAQRLVPGGMSGSLYVMGIYTGIGKGLCYDTTCEADPKWFYNRYMRKLAADDGFLGMGGFGLYAWWNSEEEDIRWCCDAAHHYFVEGSTDDFAARHGIVLDPRIVDNGNFRHGLDGWTVQGNVRVEIVKDYARNVQKRRYCRGRGDEVAVFTRSAARPNKLCQVLHNLEPGRLYALHYAVSPFSEITGRESNCKVRRYGFSAIVLDADDVTSEMPVARYEGPERNSPSLNARTLVFRAKSKTARIVFSDWVTDDEPGGEPGEELALSAVRVRAYYTGR